MESQRVRKEYLSPSAALRGSRSKSPLYISASPTSLFFSAGPRFSASSTVVDQLLILKPNVDPSKIGGIFVVIPLPVVHCSVDSTRYAPTKHSAGLSLLSAGKSSRSSSWSFNSQKTPTYAGSCARQDPLLCNTTTSSATTLWLLILFFLCRPYVTKYSRPYTRAHKTVMILSLFWIVTDKSSRR